MPSGAIRVVLPLPPSWNKSTANRSDGQGRRKTKRYRQWIKVAGAEIVAARAKWPIKRIPDGWYRIRLRLPADMPGDIDNRVKATLDLLVRMRVTGDDSLCWHSSVGRSHAVRPGTMEVRVWPAGG